MLYPHKQRICFLCCFNLVPYSTKHRVLVLLLQLLFHHCVSVSYRLSYLLGHTIIQLVILEDIYFTMFFLAYNFSESSSIQLYFVIKKLIDKRIRLRLRTMIKQDGGC